MNLLEKVTDYVIGNHTIKYYNKIINRFPEHAEEYKDQRNSIIVLGKMFPVTLDLTGIIVYSITKDPIYLSLIGAGEVLRYSIYNELQDNKAEHKEKHKIKI